jgi:hypothetical protein
MKNLFLLLTLLLPVSIFAQDKVNFTCHLKGGDILSGFTTTRTLQFATQYGNLAFPIRNVNAMELGIQGPEDEEEIVEDLNTIQFGDSAEENFQFDRLSRGAESLLPVVRTYIQAPGYRAMANRSLNVAVLYEILLAKHEQTRNFKESDVLYFDDIYSIEGLFDFESLTLDTDLGKMDIEREQIERIEVAIIEDPTINARNFKLEANQHLTANKNYGWLNTGIIAKDGQYLQISASGQIMLASLSNNIYTPDGSVNGVPVKDDGNLTFGNVVFKIGERGATRRAGADYSGKVQETGLLYLAIHETVFNENNSGAYSVRVRIE